MFTVPPKFNRNAQDVQRAGTPADTGRSLLEYLARRLGRPDLSGLDILDFGCGSRFAEAIIAHKVALASYVGVDVYQEMIEFLAKDASAADKRLSFYHFDAKNSYYNPQGVAVDLTTVLPFGGGCFDVITMFSVITHQDPTEAMGTLGLLRKYIKPDGRLFFSATVESDVDAFEEKLPDQPGAHCFYSRATIESLLNRTRWSVLSFKPRKDENLPIQDSFLCAPA